MKESKRREREWEREMDEWMEEDITTITTTTASTGAAAAAETRKDAQPNQQRSWGADTQLWFIGQFLLFCFFRGVIFSEVIYSKTREASFRTDTLQCAEFWFWTLLLWHTLQTHFWNKTRTKRCYNGEVD